MKGAGLEWEGRAHSGKQPAGCHSMFFFAAGYHMPLCLALCRAGVGNGSKLVVCSPS